MHGLPNLKICIAYIFAFLVTTIICRLYKLTLSVRAQVALHLSPSDLA